jgi:hypothetical protein
VLPDLGQPYRRLPECWKSARIIHPRPASKPRMQTRDRLNRSSCHQSSMALAAARTITPAVNRGQIAIEPAAAGCSAFRDFVHCRFADAGRRRVWLWFPTAGIRKPLHLLS